MDGKKKLVTVAEKTIPAAVQRASRWALCNAYFTLGHAVTYALLQSSIAVRCVQWTDAKADQESALCLRMLRCAVLQAAAAVLALRLPCRRRCRALAYLALMLTIVGHCILAAIAHILLVADPGDLLFRICSTGGLFVYAAGDIISFLALLLGGEE